MLQVRVEVAPRNRVLRRVVAEQRTARDSGGLGDVVDTDLVESSAGEQLEGHVGDLVACVRSAPTHPRLHASALPFRHSMPYSVESIAVCRDTTSRKAVPMEPNDQNDEELVTETLGEEV